ncbi:MAG: hypothetical protein JJE55_05635 [Flavobacteriaceae bacterium]|nr:hypothetical protein [Flavobacteriaceae bacterium]
MKNEDLKKALISEIENCQNNDLLLEALLLLIGPPPSSHKYAKVNEAETGYETQYKSPVPQEHWDLLKEQSEKLERGEITGIPWAVFEAEMRKKHDL